MGGERRPAWEKGGPSPNPGGAPKGKRISTWMAELGQEDPADWERLVKNAGNPGNGLIALARLKRAMAEEGGEQSANIVLDRTEGSVKQVHEIVPGAGMDPNDIDKKWSKRQDALQGPQQPGGAPLTLPAPESPQDGPAAAADEGQQQPDASA